MAGYLTYEIVILLLLFSHHAVSNSLQPHGLQHAILPCPSQSPRACSNSCPFSQWRHPTISSSVIPFSPCLQSFWASGSFPIWVDSLHQVAKGLKLPLEHQSFQWILRVGFFNEWIPNSGLPTCRLIPFWFYILIFPTFSTPPNNFSVTLLNYSD